MRTSRPRRANIFYILFIVFALGMAACDGGQTATPAPTNTAAVAPEGDPTAMTEATATIAMAADETPTTAAAADPGEIVWLSTQLRPVEEGEKLRNIILKDFKGKVEYLPEDTAPYVDRLLAEHRTGNVTISLVGGLHGDFPPFIQEGAMADLSTLAAKVKATGISDDFMELGKMGTDKQYYIPWMQATYIGAANKEALPHLPQGADVNKLTYDQMKEWAANIQKATGERKFGLPAGPTGLIHRIFQGYLYPAYTGRNITAYASPEAVQMWTYVKDLWQYTNPQSTTYQFMQEPLLSGEVWVAMDHVARLKDAVAARPDDFVLFPAPSGPKGLAYMPVLAGVGIPEKAPNRAGAEQLIEYLLTPAAQGATAREVAFFPVTSAPLPADLPKGVSMISDAVTAQTSADNALVSLLPVGLGAKGGEFNKVFLDTFQRIVIRGEDIQTALNEQATILQTIMTDANAKCWAPDPPSDGPCQVK
ncbi:MAG TPA: extracellular solute-binding protein [Chloroflexia bacterium]|nr:extracellular solute-binding protein [Chloroflexia bacterium]